MRGSRSVDPRYRALYDRAVEVLSADPRVKEVRVGGSIGAGTADAWSDLDLVVVTHAEHHDAFLADRDTWLAAITPTVFARTPIAPFVINTVTDDGLTFDLAVWAGEAPEWPTPPVRYAVGLLSGTQFEDLGDGPRVRRGRAAARAWPARSSACSQREEHLRHLTGVPHLLGLLTTVFLAETGSVAARQALERHLHRGAARRGGRPPAGERHPRRAHRVRPRPRRAPRHACPPALPPLRPRVAGRPRPRVTADRVQDQLGIDMTRLALLSRRSSPSTGSAWGPAGPGTST